MSRRNLRIWLVWLSLYVGTTIFWVGISQRPDVRVSHGVIMYLLLIIGASRQGGRTLSAALVLLGYLAVDYLFVPPRLSFGGASQLDWVVLIGFALTGLLISGMFDQLRRAARLEVERGMEIERLGAERVRLEREAATARALSDAGRLKNALLSSIAHDLRSPVSTLALLSDPVAGFPPDTALRRVAEEARRLAAYLGTLQRVATEDGAFVLRREAVDANALIQVALRTSQARLTQHTVRVAAPEPASRVEGDFTLCASILGNLLQNASRYSPTSAPIDIGTVEIGDAVEIIVADRGPGIAEADTGRLFSPLPSGAPAFGTPDGDARLGVGLAIARTFARAQQGDVCYRARAGGGSEFVLRLPRASDTLTSRNPTGVAAEPAPAS